MRGGQEPAAADERAAAEGVEVGISVEVDQEPALRRILTGARRRPTDDRRSRRERRARGRRRGQQAQRDRNGGQQAM
jgi:hypothetical protein